MSVVSENGVGFGEKPAHGGYPTEVGEQRSEVGDKVTGLTGEEKLRTDKALDDENAGLREENEQLSMLCNNLRTAVQDAVKERSSALSELTVLRSDSARKSWVCRAYFFSGLAAVSVMALFGVQLASERSAHSETRAALAAVTEDAGSLAEELAKRDAAIPTVDDLAKADAEARAAHAADYLAAYERGRVEELLLQEDGRSDLRVDYGIDGKARVERTVKTTLMEFQPAPLPSGDDVLDAKLDPKKSSKRGGGS